MHLKAVLQETGCALGSLCARRLAKHDRNQLVAIASSACDDIEAAVANKPCLHAVGPGVLSENAIVRVQAALAYLRFEH